MRIAYIAAGAGAMHCGACARRGAGACRPSARSRAATHPALHAAQARRPRHRPRAGLLRRDQRLSRAAQRALPASLTRWLDHPVLLRLASRSAVQIDPRHLGAMTVSVLSGRDGRQRREFDRLLDYLRVEFHPDIVHLTNSLLSGLAPEIKRQLRAPVACTFQGEDQFVSELGGPFRARALRLVRGNADASTCSSVHAMRR